MNRICLSMCLLIGSAIPALAAAETSDVHIPVGALAAVGKVDPRFQSYNVEMAEIVGGRFWAPYGKKDAQPAETGSAASGSLGFGSNLFRQRSPADLSNKRLRALARALGPAYIRVSGSWANKTYFQDDDRPPLARPPKGFDNVLTRRQWSGVLNFAKSVDARITTSFSVSEGARDQAGTWLPEEARKLLRYTRSQGGSIHSAELINEPNLGPISGLPPRYGPDNFARDVAAFRAFLQSEAPELKTVGPGSTGETGVSLFNGPGLSSEAMLDAQPRARFDYFSYHFYGGRSQRCARMAPASAILPENALSEEWLGRTDEAFAFYKALRDKYEPGAPIWLNETAQASCGGDEWAATFLDTFRYVDQMGRLAKQGVSVIMHNTLAASDYGMIDEKSLTPRPNYWAALLWRRLMGDVVLDAGPLKAGLHVYAHCLRSKPGGVALVAINLDKTHSARIDLSAAAMRYTLSADHLQSEVVNLNGRPLGLRGDALPPIRGLRISAGSLTLDPASITFLSIPTAANKACR